MKNLTALYKEMKADPDNLEKQLAYFKALADGRLTDYYRVTDKNQALREKVSSGMTEAFDSTVEAVMELHVKATEKLVAAVEKIITAFQSQGWQGMEDSRWMESAVVRQAFINLGQDI